MHSLAAIALMLVLSGCGESSDRPQPAPTPPATPAPQPKPGPTPDAQPQSQSPTQFPAQPGPRPEQAAPKGTQLPPAIVLGMRSLTIRAGAKNADTLVIVPDTRSYIEAISHWTPTLRYPVLIDDGSVEARENIGRFARAYKAHAAVRWHAPGSETSTSKPDAPDAPTLLHAVERAWGVKQPGPGALAAAWRALGHEPPGVVLVDPADGAWTGGLALAAGRGQVLATTSFKHDSPVVLWAHESDRIALAAENAAEQSGLPWRELGDTIDAVTLCAMMPTRLAGEKGEFFAITDRVGRFGKGLDIKERWAYCGQLIGDSQRSAYDAMCALFLEPTGAWLFDGYPSSEPWKQFDCRTGAEDFAKAGITPEVIGSGEGSAEHWRTRAARAVNAGVILVNTKGNADFFDLDPGQCKPADTPLLSVPAVAAIVHSWSATTPADRTTVAGRWLDHGVFAYAGSVHEPYLNAFVPTPLLVKRLLAGAAFGGAVRIDGRPLWKIAVIGDPLYAIGRDTPRAEPDVPLKGTHDVLASLRADLDAQRFEEALAALSLAGRDEDIARLVQALVEQKPDLVRPAVAALAIMPAARTGRTSLVPALFARLDAPRRREACYRDALWLTAVGASASLAEPELLAMADAIRPDVAERDASFLGACMADKLGAGRASDVLRAAGATAEPRVRDGIDKALRDGPGRWRR